MTGVIARGSGVARDLRKTMPYDNYSVVSFKISYSNKGDCWSRFLVRMEEMYESLFIIEQALNLTTSYHLNYKFLDLIQPSSNFFKFKAPTKNRTQTSMEEIIHDFKFHSEGYSILKNKIYQSVESPKGEFGLTIISQNTKKNRPKRLKLKAPGLTIYKASMR